MLQKRKEGRTKVLTDISLKAKIKAAFATREAKKRWRIKNEVTKSKQNKEAGCEEIW